MYLTLFCTTGDDVIEVDEEVYSRMLVEDDVTEVDEEVEDRMLVEGDVTEEDEEVEDRSKSYDYYRLDYCNIS